jgi:nucleotide-binding universal stress UspA family protein
MAKYRKILVAFDGSPSARNALKIAARLAGEEKSWIKVLAVVPAYEGDMELIGVHNIKETMAGPGQKLLDEAKALAAAADVHILTDMEQGEPYDKIVHVAQDEKCDLIVMGRSGHSHLERELMGSVTARVIGHTDRNVLVVPDQAELTWERILLATDGSDNSMGAVNLAMEIAREKGAALTAVSVVYTNDEFMALAPEMIHELVGKAEKVLDAIKARGAEQGLTVETVVKEGEPHQAITQLAADTNATLIIMGTFGRKGLHRLLMGSVTERTIGYAACPVLVAH